MRLLPDMIKQYFVMLTYTKYRLGVDFPQIYLDLYNHYKEGRFKDAVLVRALQISRIEQQDPKYSVDELIDSFKKGIAYPGNATAEGDLIDLLIEALNSPFSNNILTGKTISQLRKLLMSPEELVGFKERIRANKLACSGCGAELHEKEAVTFDLNNGQPTFYCNLCLQPTLVACPGCKKRTVFSERFTSKKFKDCSSHEIVGALKDEGAPVPKDPVDWAQRIILENRQARRAMGAVRAVPRAVPQAPPPPIRDFYGAGAGAVAPVGPPGDQVIREYVWQPAPEERAAMAQAQNEAAQLHADYLNNALDGDDLEPDEA